MLQKMNQTRPGLWGKYPMAQARCFVYGYSMEVKKMSREPGKKPADAARSPAAAKLAQNEADFSPSSDEVARTAYFSYVNEGSLPGRDVQHWLAAEAELIADRNRTRVHGFHNRT
jgi:hypothetical protein